MPSYAIEPGTRLVDRYRLEERLGEADGTASWRAVDETLNRAVGVRIVPADSPRAAHVLDAAREASRVSDARFLRLLDANEHAGLVYVVSEWVAAVDLAQLLREGPLPPAEAGFLAAEVAAALSSAHRQGLSHLCLGPPNVLRTEHGQVKVAGLGVEAAALGVPRPPADLAARIDAVGCGALLYAALTARWPAPAPTAAAREAPVATVTSLAKAQERLSGGLPAAPTDDGRLCSPRQVRAGVPSDLDAIAVRALDAQGGGNGRALLTPGDVAAALAATPPVAAAGAVTGPLPHVGQPVERDPSTLVPTGPGPATKIARVATAALLAVGVGLIGWQVVSAERNRSGSAGSAGAAPTGAPLRIGAATSFDPEGDQDENGDRVGRAYDGNPATAWQTKTYDEQLGPKGLKRGVGLVLDLGRQVPVAAVTLDLEGSGSSIELRAANTRGAALTDYRRLAEGTDVSSQVTLRPPEAVASRYLLVWFTALPALPGGGYRGAISEITVRS